MKYLDIYEIFLYFYGFQRITFYKSAEVEKLPNYC